MQTLSLALEISDGDLGRIIGRTIALPVIAVALIWWERRKRRQKP
jgi:hypothetical protein